MSQGNESRRTKIVSTTIESESSSNGGVFVGDQQPKWMTIAGWVCTGLVAFALVASASMKFMPPNAEMVEGMKKSGFDPALMMPIGIVELACALIYLFPRTAVLGAVLIAGYMGGAIFAHVRIHEPFFVQAIIGVLAWLGIFLREPRLRPIMFWR